MSNGISAGDVVQLKSGGPHMTVARFEEINGVMNAVCGWFDGNKKEVGTFPVGSLKVVDPTAAGPAIRIGKPGFRS